MFTVCIDLELGLFCPPIAVICWQCEYVTEAQIETF